MRWIRRRSNEFSTVVSTSRRNVSTPMTTSVGSTAARYGRTSLSLLATKPRPISAADRTDRKMVARPVASAMVPALDVCNA
jgi:hypothetical protein